MLRRLILLTLLLALPGLAPAQDKSAVERQFQTWLSDTIWPRARAKGVSRATFQAAFAQVTLNWDLPDLVPPGGKPLPQKIEWQAEFGTPAAYFNSTNLTSITTLGQKMETRHSQALRRVEAQTGVPARIILAIWGRESGFGRAPIRYDAFEVLGTKGFMSTRAAFFTEELIAALEMLEAGHVTRRNMKSSWAGALGQPQFMPRSYLAYARDGDGDGRADIWGSEEDTFASIAAYLKQFGWIAGRDWGFEVALPANLSCTLAGPDQARRISDWADLGVTRISGRPFPAHELNGQGTLLLPAGRNGPAFIVTPNFYVLKDYNFSDLYALYVGHMGDRIAYDMKDFQQGWTSLGRIKRGEVAALQSVLEAQGHDVGGVDGLAGFRTRRAVGLWQEANGHQPTCFPDRKVIKAITK